MWVSRGVVAGMEASSSGVRGAAAAHGCRSGGGARHVRGRQRRLGRPATRPVSELATAPGAFFDARCAVRGGTCWSPFRERGGDAQGVHRGGRSRFATWLSRIPPRARSAVCTGFFSFVTGDSKGEQRTQGAIQKRQLGLVPSQPRARGSELGDEGRALCSKAKRPVNKGASKCCANERQGLTDWRSTA